MDIQPNILITDDNPVNRKILNDTISKVFGPPDTAIDGKLCLSKLKNKRYDLLLLDLNMPETDGLSVLTELRKSATGERPNVIVVSAENDPKTISEALKLGAADYVTVPFNHYELMARIKTQLRLKNRELDLEYAVSERTSELEAANQRLKAAQRQLILAEKMASLGQLSAGIAHEVNNPIGYVGSNLESLADYGEDLLAIIDELNTNEETQAVCNRYQLPMIKEDLPDILRDCKTGIQRVQQIISDLKSFSHPENRQWETAHIDECFRTVLNIVRHEIKYKADILVDVDDHLPAFECITNQIFQVLTNLIINASQAIEGQGTIKVGASTDENKELMIITIEDDGCGMSENVKTKVFDPFFTTKPVGQGTGLGMSVTYGIIEAHNGKISVDSEEGKGTRFTIELPLKQHTL